MSSTTAHLSGTAESRASESARIPSLDGLRAVSIALVLLGHLPGTRGFPLPAHEIFVPVARYGVDVFFVISGFLITRLLIGEQRRTGSISLKDFYIRRLFRIFPANYFYVLVIWLCSVAGLFVLEGRDIWRAVTYTMNYVVNPNWYLGHLWSLSVEEQFYLLWPFLLTRVSRERAVQVAVAVVVLSPFIRVGTAVLAPRQVPLLDSAFHTVADALAAGCLLAMCWRQLENWSRYQAFLRSRMFWMVPAVVAVSIPFSYLSWKFAIAAGSSIQILGSFLIIERFVRYPGGTAGAFLNWAPVQAIGVLSYSLYLWQQPFLHRGSDAWWAVFPLNLAAALAAAAASYFLVEKPFLALRKKFVKAPVPASPR